jgi:predicted lactoylglutathione lyase
MAQAIYLNLLVNDLSKSRKFFETLGYSFNEEFSNEEAAGLVISESIYAMLHTDGSFKRFTTKTLVNSKENTEAIFALQFGSKEEVDALIENAIKAGGNEYRETEDHGFMYGRSFEDLDGHIWEAFWMNPDAG